MPNLQGLILYNNQISGKGVATLATALRDGAMPSCTEYGFRGQVNPNPNPNPHPNPHPNPNPNPNPNPGPNQMLRLLRAVEPVSSSVSEAQLAEALAPLARHLPGHVAGDVT